MNANSFLWILYTFLVVTALQSSQNGLSFSLCIFRELERENEHTITRVKCTSCLYYWTALSVLSWPSVHRQSVCYHTLRGQDIKWLCKLLYFEDFLHFKDKCFTCRQQISKTGVSLVWHDLMKFFTCRADREQDIMRFVSACSFRPACGLIQ